MQGLNKSVRLLWSGDFNRSKKIRPGGPISITVTPKKTEVHSGCGFPMPPLARFNNKSWEIIFRNRSPWAWSPWQQKELQSLGAKAVESPRFLRR